jgi:hypothetical protein
VSLIVFCLGVSGALYAQSGGDDERVGMPDADRVEATTPEPPARERPRQVSKPSPTFNPSEKIGADSAVSFPVDI